MKHVIVVVVALASACAGTKQQIKTEASAPQKPVWIGQLPAKPGLIHVVGVKTRAKTLEEGKQGASSNAAAQISNAIITKIESDFQSYSSTEFEADKAEEKTQSQTAAFIQELKIVDEYYEKTTRVAGSFYEESFDVYLLGQFPEEAAERERLRIADEHKAKAKDALNRATQAQSQVAAKKFQAALSTFRQSRNILRAIPANIELGGAYAQSSDLMRDVEQKLEELEQAAFGLKIDFEAADALAKQLIDPFASQLAGGLAKTPLKIKQEGARFVLKLRVQTNATGRQVMGQQVAQVVYSATVKDQWTGLQPAGSTEEMQGFGKSVDAALNDATQRAAEKVAEVIGKTLTDVLKEEQAKAES